MIATSIFLVLCSVSVFAAPSNSSVGVVPLEKSQPKIIPILSQSEDLEANGTYIFSYETGNGIKREEKAFDKVLPPVARSAHHGEDGEDNADNSEIHVQQGSYSYTAPDGTVISLSYVADENGFQPHGEHLPKAPTVSHSEEDTTNRIATKAQEKEDNEGAASEPKETKTAVPALLSRSAIDNNDSTHTDMDTKIESEDLKSKSTANTESTEHTDLPSATEVSETSVVEETSEQITTDTNAHEPSKKFEVTTQESYEEIGTTDSARESEISTTEDTSTAAST